MQLIASFALPEPLPKNHWDAARRYLAKALDGQDASWLLANDNGPAPYRVSLSRQSVEIVALGIAASTLLAQKAEDLSKTLTAFAQKPVPYHIGGGECAVSASTTLHYYTIPRLVWQGGKPSQWPAQSTMEQENGNAFGKHIKTIIAKDLIRQAETFALPCDEHGSIIKVKATPLSPVRIKPDAPRLLASARVHFATNYDIRGIWHIGKLCSRGYGRIRRLRDPKELEN